jgi:hypothetical protein
MHLKLQICDLVLVLIIVMSLKVQCLTCERSFKNSTGLSHHQSTSRTCAGLQSASPSPKKHKSSLGKHKSKKHKDKVPRILAAADVTTELEVRRSFNALVVPL